MANKTVPHAPRPRIFHHSAGVVVLRHGHCLALRRGREWLFPKGHLEAGERPVDAAVREVREETGLEITVDGYIGSTRYDFGPPSGPEMSKRVDWYWGHVVSGVPVVVKPFDEVTFLPAQEVLARLTHDSDREIAVQALALAGGGGPVDSGPEEA